MKDHLVRNFMFVGLILFSSLLFAQQNPAPAEQGPPQKIALVIGNSAYTNLTPLANPVNDANDIAVVLEYIGFSVDKVLNGSLEQMEDAIVKLQDDLREAQNAYGFFFYAGHGIQSGGENYLIPVDANIPSEGYLRNRAVSVQAMLDDLNDARNDLNVIVLDACRDNPFGWSRSSTRGLAIITRQPADSIIVYSTSAGQRASDGEGRNGLFTSQLINNLATPNLEVTEVFKRTGADVARVSKNQQIPAIYSQLFKTAYLGEAPADGYVMAPSATVIIGGGGEKEPMPAKLWSIGASVGSSFSDPWVVGTLRGTVAPFKYQFLEVGLNAGLVSMKKQVTSFFSITPYLNYSFFWPFNKAAAVYAGAGVGFTTSRYEYYKLDISISALPADFNAGVLLFNFLDISYTLSYPLWTKSSSDTPIGRALLSSLDKKVSNKFAVGYTYRFN